MYDHVHVLISLCSNTCLYAYEFWYVFCLFVNCVHGRVLLIMYECVSANVCVFVWPCVVDYVRMRVCVCVCVCVCASVCIVCVRLYV